MNDDNDCNHDNDSEEKMPDDSDDNGYNEYGKYDRGYYYYNRGYERKISLMVSPIISLVTT